MCTRAGTSCSNDNLWPYPGMTIESCWDHLSDDEKRDYVGGLFGKSGSSGPISAVPAKVNLRKVNLAGRVIPPGKPFVGVDFSKAVFEGATLHGGAKQPIKFDKGCNLTGTYFNRADIEHVEFTKCILTDTFFGKARLSECKFVDCHGSSPKGTSAERSKSSHTVFSGAHLEKVRFERCALGSSDFEGAWFKSVKVHNGDLSRCRFDRLSARDGLKVAGVSDFSYSTFDNANLEKVCFGKDTKLNGSSFGRANLAQAGVAKCEIAGGDFRGANLGGADFSGSTLTMCRFADAHFSSGSHADHVRFTKSDLSGSDFRSTDLQRQEFHGTILSGVQFQNANLSGAKFVDCPRCERVNFQACDIQGGSIRNSILDGASFQGADMSRLLAYKSSFAGATMQSVNLTRARLVDCQLNGTLLQGSLMHGANLSKSRFQGAALDSCDLSGAILTNCDLTGASFSAANFSTGYGGTGGASPTLFNGAILNGVDFSARDLRGLNFRGCELKRAKFVDAQLERCDFRDAKLGLAVLSGASLTGADFRFTDLTGAQLGSVRCWDDAQGSASASWSTLFDCADMQDSNLAYSTIRAASFRGTKLDRSSIRGANAEGADFGEAGLISCDMEGIRLGPLKLLPFNNKEHRLSNLSRVRGKGVLLRGASLEGVFFCGASLLAANLDWASLHNCFAYQADLSFSSLQHSSLEKAVFTAARFNSASLGNASLIDSYIGDVIFKGADLSHAHLGISLEEQATIVERCQTDENYKSSNHAAPTTLEDVLAPDCHFTRRNLTNCSFNRANLERASLRDSQIEGCDFTDANLSNVNLSDADDWPRACLCGAIMHMTKVPETEEKFRWVLSKQLGGMASSSRGSGTGRPNEFQLCQCKIKGEQPICENEYGNGNKNGHNVSAIENNVGCWTRLKNNANSLGYYDLESYCFVQEQKARGVWLTSPERMFARVPSSPLRRFYPYVRGWTRRLLSTTGPGLVWGWGEIPLRTVVCSLLIVLTFSVPIDIWVRAGLPDGIVSTFEKQSSAVKCSQPAKFPQVVSASGQGTKSLYQGGKVDVQIERLKGDKAGARRLSLHESYWAALGISLLAFTTLGFGAYIATGAWSNFWIGLEGFLGIVLMSLFVVALARRTSGR